MSKEKVTRPQQLPASPVHDLKPRTVGNFAVKVRTLPAGAEVDLVGFRESLTAGIPLNRVTLDAPLRIRSLEQLSGNHIGVWMTDLPQELMQLQRALDRIRPRGRVLIGGLGLGCLAKMVSALPEVDEVVVIEREQYVIALCQQPGYEVRCDDIARYLRMHRSLFDFYLLDTWAGTSEGTWWNEVLPLKRTLGRQFGESIAARCWCWAEDQMAGQVYRALLTPGKKDWFYEGLTPMKPATAQSFLVHPGTRGWERRWGAIVDRNYARINKAERRA